MSFSVEAVVRGYHKYKDIRLAVVGEELSCRREPTNRDAVFQILVRQKKEDNLSSNMSILVSSTLTFCVAL